MAGLTIGKFAGAEGAGVETVRSYQRRGLLARPARGRSGLRGVHRRRPVAAGVHPAGRRLGFTLAAMLREVADFL